MRNAWKIFRLKQQANEWFDDMSKIMRQQVSEYSPWWPFCWNWGQCILPWLDEFSQGGYLFSPMTQMHFYDETVRLWSYADRLIIKLILTMIKNTLKHIISRHCYHLKGPGGVKTIIRAINNALACQEFHYIIRGDIRGYYASISRHILTQQLHRHYQDPRLQNYFEQIVNIAIDRDGDVFVPTHGIPRRSSLSPFFGALYLSDLDHAMENRAGIAYFRYMDDFIILAQTKRQYQRAKKILYDILASLELTLSPSKTRMGVIDNGFHFLGAHFEVSRNPQTKLQVIRVTLHNRSCARALDKVKALDDNAVHPAIKQRYLIRWATWWSATIPSLRTISILMAWILHTSGRDPTLVWLGRGLIPLSFFHACQ